MTCDNCGNCKPKAVIYGGYYGIKYKGEFYPFGKDGSAKFSRDNVLNKTLKDPDYITGFVPYPIELVSGEKKDG